MAIDLHREFSRRWKQMLITYMRIYYARNHAIGMNLQTLLPRKHQQIWSQKQGRNGNARTSHGFVMKPMALIPIVKLIVAKKLKHTFSYHGCVWNQTLNRSSSSIKRSTSSFLPWSRREKREEKNSDMNFQLESAERPYFIMDIIYI